MPKIAASTALSRLRILDLSRVRAGPTCVKQFADFGADVIKIESPPGVDPNEAMGGPREGPDMQNLHRNKRAMRSEEHTSELQSRLHLVCRLLLEKKKRKTKMLDRPDAT